MYMYIIDRHQMLEMPVQQTTVYICSVILHVCIYNVACFKI